MIRLIPNAEPVRRECHTCNRVVRWQDVRSIVGTGWARVDMCPVCVRELALECERVVHASTVKPTRWAFIEQRKPGRPRKAKA